MATNEHYEKIMEQLNAAPAPPNNKVATASMAPAYTIHATTTPTGHSFINPLGSGVEQPIVVLGRGNQIPPVYVTSTTTALADNYSEVYGKTPQTPADFFHFNDASVRRAFIRKVFSILGIQLSITMAMTCWFIFEENTKRFVQSHIEFLIVALVVKLVVLIALFCFGELRRKAPSNYILLFMFTVAKSFLVATLATFYDKLAVALAVILTTVVCIGLILFAFQTKWDFTGCGGFLFVIFLILIMFGITSSFLYSQIAQLLYGTLGAIVFSVYLVYDVQLMIGGGHRYQISPEEYVFAALNIFIDVVNIFVFMLRIFGSR